MHEQTTISMDELEQYATQALEENKILGIVEEVTETTETIENKTEVIEEKPKEETAAVAEETKAVETPSILDVLSSLNTETEKPKEVELPEDIKARLALADKWEQFSKSEIAQLLETDLTPLDLVSGVQVVDYSKMSIEQLITENAKLIAGDRFNEEMVEESIEAYNRLPTSLDKIEYEKKLIEKLGSNRVDYKNELVKKIQDHQSAKKANQVPATNFDEVAKAEKSALENTLNDLATNHGLEKEIADGIKGLYSIEMAGHFVDKKTNKFNEREFIQFTYKAVAFDKEIAKVKAEAVKLVAEAEAKAYEKAKKEFTNPDAHGSGGAGNVEISPEEAYKIAMNGR